MNDPYEVLGVPQDATEEQIRRAYRDLVRRHHPDRHAGASDSQRKAFHRRTAEITAAFRMLRDPDELERFRRLRQRNLPGRQTVDEPGRRGVHFAAGDPRSGEGVGPAPGDPDFDYRTRAPSEFDLTRTTAAPQPRSGGWWRRRRGRRAR